VTLLNEAAETDQGLEDYLKDDASLTSMVTGIWSTFIGRKSEGMPIVRFFQVETDDLMTIMGNRVWTEIVYQVEAIDRGTDTTAARAISQRVDQLLHLLRGETFGHVLVEEVYRRAPLFRRELEGDQPYIYAGAEYVFHVSTP